jgi:hypothetical protein
VVFHEGNTVLHKVDYEGDPRRRALTYDEIQALFDAADTRLSQSVKGGLCAARDAAVLKTICAFGPDAPRHRSSIWSNCGAIRRFRDSAASAA